MSEAPYHGTAAPMLDFVHETFDCVRIQAEIATRYAELGDTAGLEYSTRKMAAYLRAAIPIVKASPTNACAECAAGRASGKRVKGPNPSATTPERHAGNDRMTESDTIFLFLLMTRTRAHAYKARNREFAVKFCHSVIGPVLARICGRPFGPAHRHSGAWPVSTIIEFPRIAKALSRTPDAVAVVHDFGMWTVAFFCGGRFLRRTQHKSKAAVRAEAERQVAGGLRWHVGRDMP